MNPDWVKLVSEGRAKDVGIAWSDEEDKALRDFQIPADYVRDGILNPEDYAKALEKEVRDGVKPLARMSVEDLTQKAQKLGIKMTPDVSKDSLVRAIKGAYALKKNKAKQQAAVREVYENLEKEEAAKAQAFAKKAESPIEEPKPKVQKPVAKKQNKSKK